MTSATANNRNSVVVDSLGRNEIETNADFIEWQRLSVDDALSRLKSSPDGLPESEVTARQSLYGANEIVVARPSRLKAIFWFLWNPMAWLLELGVIAALVFGQWIDAAIIFIMLIVNAAICFYGDNTSSHAADHLKDQLALKCHVKRGGQWREVKASKLTIGDVVLIQDGDVVPADCKLLTKGVLLCDELALTGQEKSPNKTQGDICFSGSLIKTGTGEAIVFAIGNDTFFGTAVELMRNRHKGRLQGIMTNIGNFSISIIVVMIILELSIQKGYRSHPWNSAVANTMVLVIGAVPIAMPTVLSVIMAIGAMSLAKKNIIVRRLNAIEELASMDILCANKSGTICTGQIEIDHSETVAVNGHTAEEVLFYAAVAAHPEPKDPIDKVVVESCPLKDSLWVELERLHYVPFDPVQKRTITSIRVRANGNTFRAAKGAPWAMLLMDKYSDLLKQEVESKISDLAQRGFSLLGVAVSRDPSDMPIKEVHWELVGLLALKDPPRADCANSLKGMNELGVDVKMITGEDLASAVETCKILGISTNLQTGKNLEQSPDDNDAVERADGFAELNPQHKFAIVERLQNRDRVVGISGTSVNDCPALQKADIGIAVPGSVVSARSASDVVLMLPGLAIVIEAVKLSRIIFRRMHTYALYSLVTAVQIVLTFGLLTLFYDWYISAFCILIMVVLNDGSLLVISRDTVLPSKTPERWNLRSIFIQALAFGAWLSFGTLMLFVIARHTSMFSALRLDSLSSFGGTFKVDHSNPLCNWELWFDVRPPGLSGCSADQQAALTAPATYEARVWRLFQQSLAGGGAGSACHQALAQAVCGIQQTRLAKLRSLIYMIVSITGHAVIFAARTSDFMWKSRPSKPLIAAFAIAQLISTLLGTLGFGRRFSARTYFAGVGPATAVFAWLWAILLILPLDFIKFSLSKFIEKPDKQETTETVEEQE